MISWSALRSRRRAGLCWQRSKNSSSVSRVSTGPCNTTILSMSAKVMGEAVGQVSNIRCGAGWSGEFPKGSSGH